MLKEAKVERKHNYKSICRNKKRLLDRERQLEVFINWALDQTAKAYDRTIIDPQAEVAFVHRPRNGNEQSNG